MLPRKYSLWIEQKKFSIENELFLIEISQIMGGGKVSIKSLGRILFPILHNFSSFNFLEIVL